MHNFLKDKLSEALKKLNYPQIEIEVEIPKNKTFGDLSTPIAMEISRHLKNTSRTNC